MSSNTTQASAAAQLAIANFQMQVLATQNSTGQVYKNLNELVTRLLDSKKTHLTLQTLKALDKALKDLQDTCAVIVKMVTEDYEDLDEKVSSRSDDSSEVSAILLKGLLADMRHNSEAKKKGSKSSTRHEDDQTKDPQ
jgi:hypothetical protein